MLGTLVVRVGMAPRARGLDFETFQERWSTGHAALAATLEGLRGYVQNHALLAGGRPLLPYPGFDACSELCFDSLEAMDAAFDSDHYRNVVTSDEQSLVDKSRFGLMLTERRVLSGGEAGEFGERAEAGEDTEAGECGESGEAGEDAVKLLTFFSVDRNSSHAELSDALAGPYREAVAAAAPLRHEQFLLIPGAHDGRRSPMADAADMLWFAGADDALSFVGSDADFAAAYALAGRAFGAQRLLARAIRVV
jgi:uncharacterized protein (TIGR02118 family)